MYPDSELQQKAQKLREQAGRTSAPWLDGAENIGHLVDGILQVLETPAPDFDKMGAQLTALVETVQNALPEMEDAGNTILPLLETIQQAIPNIDAGDAIQPLLESISDLLSALGDLGS